MAQGPSLRSGRRRGRVRSVSHQHLALPHPGQHEDRHHADGADHGHAEKGVLAELAIEHAGELEDHRLRGAGADRVIDALAQRRAVARQGALDEGHGAEMAGGEGAGMQRLQQRPAPAARS